jgi:ATP-dependent 26S proteasome regulatory subunit
MTFREVLDELIKARFPILYVETFEEARVIAEIQAVVGPEGSLRNARQLVLWSASTGLVSAGGVTGPSHAQSLTQSLDQVLQAIEPTVFVFLDAHAELGGSGRPADPFAVRKFRDIAEHAKTSNVPVTIILVAPAVHLPPDLEKDITLVDFPLPSETEIGELLNTMITSNSEAGRIEVLLDEGDKERLVKAAQGLTLVEAENAFARAMVNDGKLDGSDVEVILEEKRQTIRKSGLLEYVPVDVGIDDIGGLENLKRWLAKRANSWLDDAIAYGIPAPKGVLISGVPGCGKSLTAKAIAASWGLPLLRMDIGKVFSGLVGSSEQNMRAAMKTAEAIAPCVLWIDEIEKGFAGSSGSGDSGTSARVFGSFLTWMQEKKSPVFVIATANKIEALPPEFLRKGRFDEIFFVDLPTQSERIPIWRVHLGRRLQQARVHQDVEFPDDQILALAEASEGYSGAEIEQAVVAALFDAYAERRPVTFDDLMRAIVNMVPLSVTQAEQIAAIRAWADVRAVAATTAEDRDSYAVASATEPAPPEPVTPSRGGRMVDF